MSKEDQEIYARFVAAYVSGFLAHNGVSAISSKEIIRSAFDFADMAINEFSRRTFE